MSTENPAKKIDLVVMTGSVPFITAGIFHQNHTEASLLSGALSGMSNMFQEMLQQGELRHTELYNAHIYVRHLRQINDNLVTIDPEIKLNSKMSVAIIVREDELTREQELALSELCYSIMVKISQKSEFSQKLRNGNIEGYVPSSKEAREILSEALEDFRKRAKKSLFYEKTNYLQEKEKFLIYPLDDSLLEGRIDEFYTKLVNQYYPDYFPKIPFVSFFGKLDYYDAVIQLKSDLETLIQTDDFREKVISNLFQYIMEAGLIPLVLYSSNIIKRLELFMQKDLPLIFYDFLKNYLFTRGPIGICLNAIESNILKIRQEHPKKIYWIFLKSYLENLKVYPFESTYLKQLVKLLEDFELSESFMFELNNLLETKTVPKEYIDKLINIFNANFSSPYIFEELDTHDILKDFNKINSDQTNGPPQLPASAKITILDESEYQEYQQLKEQIQLQLNEIVNSFIFKLENEKEKLAIDESELKAVEKLNELLGQIEEIMEKGSFGNYIKTEYEKIKQNIIGENYELAQTLLLQIIESLETTESLDESFFEILTKFRNQNQEIINSKNTMNRTSKKKTILSKNANLKNLASIKKEIDQLIYSESFSELTKLMTKNKALFDKDNQKILKENIQRLISIKMELISKEKVEKKKSSKINKENEKVEKMEKIILPKPTPESSLINDTSLLQAVSQTFNWVHELIYGRFTLDRKNTPTAINSGLLFQNISESLSIEIGLIFDIIQSFTSVRSWIIGQVERLIETVENKIIIYEPSIESKYESEERFAIDLKYVDDQFKKRVQKIIEILNQIEADASSSRMTLENKKYYIETGFLGRIQENSIPSAKKYLSELKSLNKSLSNKEINHISKTTTINFQDLTTNITSTQLIVTPFPVKESDFSKKLRDLITQVKSLNIDIFQILEIIFYLKMEIKEPIELLYSNNLLDNILRQHLPSSVNNLLDILPNTPDERRLVMELSFEMKKELFILIGSKLLSNKPLRAFSSITFNTTNNTQKFIFNFPAISPPLLSDELRKYFILIEENEKLGIIGRVYNYKPFKDDVPTNLTGLIISDAFRRAYETIEEGLAKIIKIGMKLHQGVPILLNELMESYQTIKEKLISK